MKTIIVASGGGAALLLIGLITIISRRRVRRIRKNGNFQAEWKELQKFCHKPETWGQALMAADELLFKALKKRRFHGKSMGEKLVAAQRYFTSNDTVWASHKLCKQIRQHPRKRLTENQVKNALIAVRQALKDLGAL